MCTHITLGSWWKLCRIFPEAFAYIPWMCLRMRKGFQWLARSLSVGSQHPWITASASLMQHKTNPGVSWCILCLINLSLLPHSFALMRNLQTFLKYTAPFFWYIIIFHWLFWILKGILWSGNGAIRQWDCDYQVSQYGILWVNGLADHSGIVATCVNAKVSLPSRVSHRQPRFLQQFPPFPCSTSEWGTKE